MKTMRLKRDHKTGVVFVGEETSKHGRVISVEKDVTYEFYNIIITNFLDKPYSVKIGSGKSYMITVEEIVKEKSFFEKLKIFIGGDV